MKIVKSNSKRLIKILTAGFVGVGVLLFAVALRDHKPVLNSAEAPERGQSGKGSVRGIYTNAAVR